MTGVRYMDMAKNYCDVNSSALLMLDAFGGCAVSYEELIDHDETVWAVAISNVIGLSAEALLSARNKRVQKKNTKAEEPLVDLDDVRTAQVYDRLQKLRGLTIPPSRQISRKIKG